MTGFPPWKEQKDLLDSLDDGSSPGDFHDPDGHAKLWIEFKEWAKDKLGQGFSLAVKEDRILDPMTDYCFFGYYTGVNKTVDDIWKAYQATSGADPVGREWLLNAIETDKISLNAHYKEIIGYRKALQQIADWQFPPVQHAVWSNGKPCTVDEAYGTIGAIEYVRTLAKEILKL